jgi:2,5-furandicarboxylate decarboxylase 1
LGPQFYVEVTKKLSPIYEVQVIQEKLAYEKRFPVTYCPEIEGSKLPLVTCLCSSYPHVAVALDIDPMKASDDEIFLEYPKRASETRSTKTVPASSAPVKEVVIEGKDVDLGILPVTKQAPLNSGKYITAGQLICRDPDTGILNTGIYRHMVKGKDRLGFRAVPTNDAAYIIRRYAELGKPMEVVIFIGHHPATCLGSVSSSGIDINELEVMGGYLGESLEVTQCETVELPVPARAEIAIEGVIDPSKMETDGPFAEWMGYYGEVYDCYIIQINAMTMRRDAIYHDLDSSHIEHNFMFGIGGRSNTYEAVKKVAPTVKDVYLPSYGGGQLIVYVSIKKRVPGEGKRAAWAALNSHANRKIAVVVDDDVDVYNDEEVWWAVATRCRPDVDIDIVPHIASALRDPTSYDETGLKRGNLNAKILIDATKPVELPFATRITPDPASWQRISLEEYIKGYERTGK